MLSAPSSLRARLLWMVLGTSLCVWLAAALATWNDARHELDQLLDGHLAQAAALLVAQQVHEFEDEERVDAPSLHRYGPRVTFQVFHENRLVLRSAHAPDRPLVGDGTAPVHGFHTVVLEGQRWRVFATRGAERDVRVLVGEQTASRDAILRAVLRSTLWPMLVALPLLAVAGWWAVRRGVQPLRALGRTLEGRPADDLRPVEPAGAPDEMRPLLTALNGLFGRIGQLLERERRFTGDAAHELRTPIAAIRAQAQVALGATEEAERRRALERTLAGCDRAVRVVEQLLLLSRLDAECAPARSEVNLSALAQSVVAELAVAGIARQQAVSLVTGPEAVVAGDETLLAALCRNLVDNALRYSPPGARVEVRVDTRDDQVLLAVEDSGPGMAEADLARLGQRFFRVTGNEAPGSGLGWSIARRIAAAHGASLQAGRSPRLGGLRVGIAFPRPGHGVAGPAPAGDLPHDAGTSMKMPPAPSSPAAPQRTLVWDAPVRVFHWLMVASFTVAWLSSDGDEWQVVHNTAGYTMAGLVGFRLLWGLVGTRHARFSAFVRGPLSALRYLGSLLTGRPEHHAGHNPAGGLAILALLALTALTVATGWAYYGGQGGERWEDRWEDLHEGLANGMLALVGLHVAAVAVSSLLHRENLVAAMFHGHKTVPPREGIRSPWRTVAALLLGAVLGFWWMQWAEAAPASTPHAAMRK